jgi:DNA-binding CsgD family transcriptional regulator
MSLAELIALASLRSGKRQKSLAEEMGHSDRTKLSKISSG